MSNDGDEIKISSTRLGLFLTCRRKWYYSVVEGREIESSEPMDFGTLVHACLEFRLERGYWPLSQDIARMDGNYEDPVKVIERRGGEFFNRCKRRAKVAWGTFEIDESAWEAEVPVEDFGLKLSGFLCSGWYDLFSRQLHAIGDWKTRGSFGGWMPRSEADFRGDVQLCYYAACVRRALGWDSVKVVHFNIHRDYDDVHLRVGAELGGAYLDKIWEDKLADKVAPEMRRLVDGGEIGEATRNPTACHKYGKLCPFYADCDPDHGDSENSSASPTLDDSNENETEYIMNINPPDAPDDEEPIPYDEKPISKLDLDVRAERNLKDAGYDTFGDLDGVDKSTLEDVSWVGEKTAQSILDTLDAFRE